MNDTHPALVVPELMRLLIDNEDIDWDKAWDITVNTCAYTNHTLLPEALERWPVSMFERLLPRHLQIIYEINSRFMRQVATRYPGDFDRLKRMSIIQEEPEKAVRMASLAVVGSHAINGVAELHSKLLREGLMQDYANFYPGRFTNVTNGVTPRRWLLKANPGLSSLISSKIGTGWISDLPQLRKLEPFAKDAQFRKQIRDVKRANKVALADYIKRELGVEVSPDSVFQSQVKRMHEYKRQLLQCLYIIVLYNRIKANRALDIVPQTFIFAGKAAPGYQMAKLIIKLINQIAGVINNDPEVASRLKVVFLPDYRVSLAEKIIPASDISLQISTAGMEASGTGNMKFQMNGALTIGTLDGANIEIKEEVGDDNIFIFGLTTEEVEGSRGTYNPRLYYDSDEEIRQAVDLIRNDFFSLIEPGIFKPIVGTLLDYGDYYMNLADLRSFINIQGIAEDAYRDQDRWTEMAILNIARAGKFSSDRAIDEYAKNIWHVKPVDVVKSTEARPSEPKAAAS